MAQVNLSGTKFKLFVTYYSGKVKTYHTRKYRRLLHLIDQVHNHQWLELSVMYADGSTNVCKVVTKAQLRFALAAFTEPDLIDYVANRPLAQQP